jgi:hypothetical protein
VADPCSECPHAFVEPHECPVCSDPATLRAQLAEARAEVERVTREREEQRRRRESVEADREALVREVAAARRERDEARAELAAERARREADASPYAIIAGAAGALHGKSLDECPHPKGSHPEALWGLGWWEVTARRHEKRAERIRAEARARGLVAVLREARALLIDEHDEGEGVSCGACSAVVRIDAALAAAEGGE